MRRVLIPYGNGRAVVSPLYHGFFDDIFNDTFKGSPMNVILRSNIKETETSYVVEAELAGYNKDDISVDMSDGVLTISAETKKELEDKKDSYVRKERYEGKVSRSYSFDGVDEENVKAKYENGILTIELQKVIKNASKKNIVIE